MTTMQKQNETGIQISSPNFYLKDDFVERNRILFVGFRNDKRGELERMVAEFDLVPMFCSNISGLEAFTGSSDSIIALITDSMFLGFSSPADWKKVRDAMGDYPFWLHISDDTRPSVIVNMMKNGLDEFVGVAARDQSIIKHLKFARKAYENKRKELEKKDSEALILRKHVEWANYKESLRMAGHDVSGKEAITNLRTSLSQGAGFGLMISLMEMIGMSPVGSDDKVTVDKFLIDTIQTNVKYTRRMIDGLEEYVRIMDHDLRIAPVPVSQIEMAIKQRLAPASALFSKKKINLRISETCSSRTVDADIELVLLAVEELVLNAWKYSKKDTNVTLLTSISVGYYSITIQSFPQPYSKFSLDQDSLEKLKMPFYRLHPPVEDVIEMEKFVMGLGLSAVEHIAARQSGVFVIEGGTDYCGTKSEECFLAYFMLPLSR
jgi:hypothetical protein